MAKNKRKNTYFRKTSREFKASKFIRNLIHKNKNIPIKIIKISRGTFDRTLKSLRIKEKLPNFNKRSWKDAKKGTNR